MQLNVMCSISGMSKVDFNYTYKDFTLVNGGEKLDGSLFDDNFIKQVGVIQCKEFINAPYFAVVYSNYETDIDFFKISDGIYGELNHLIDNLWFAKDCCPTLNSLYFYSPTAKRIFVRKNNGRPSDNKGMFNSSAIEESDFKLAEQISSKFDRELPVKVRQQAEPITDGTNRTILPSFYFLDYNLTLRLEKCSLFLGLARHQAALPVKIVMYMSILECLFTSDSSELSHKVAERAAVYLKTSKEETYNNFRIIKSGYDFRSKFLHGQNFKKKKDTYEVLSEISTNIDELIRRILKKAILNDFDLFNSFEDSDIDNHFNQMIFEKD